jgi:hypothetical protein
MYLTENNFYGLVYLLITTGLPGLPAGLDVDISEVY